MKAGYVHDASETSTVSSKYWVQTVNSVKTSEVETATSWVTPHGCELFHTSTHQVMVYWPVVYFS